MVANSNNFIRIFTNLNNLVIKRIECISMQILLLFFMNNQLVEAPGADTYAEIGTNK